MFPCGSWSRPDCRVPPMRQMRAAVGNGGLKSEVLGGALSSLVRGGTRVKAVM